MGGLSLGVSASSQFSILLAQNSNLASIYSGQTHSWEAFVGIWGTFPRQAGYASPNLVASDSIEPLSS